MNFQLTHFPVVLWKNLRKLYWFLENTRKFWKVRLRKQVFQTPGTDEIGCIKNYMTSTRLHRSFNKKSRKFLKVVMQKRELLGILRRRRNI